MKRLVVIIMGALALALPGGAGALKGSPGDGTLVVENAQGVVVLNVRGGIIGRFDSGSIVVEDPTLGDGPGPVVRGYESATEIGPSKVQYSSKGEIRFRLIGGLYRVRIAGQGVDVSVVGRGTAMLNGAGFSDLQTGRYSLNGGAWQRMPNLVARFTLGTPLPGQSSR